MRHGDLHGDMTAFLILEREFCQCADREDGTCVCGWWEEQELPPGS